MEVTSTDRNSLGVKSLRLDKLPRLCNKSVEEWVVTFEWSIHTDSGYDKRHCCPHCGAKSFADTSESAWIFLFFVVFYVSAPPWGLLLWHLNDAFEWKCGDDALGFLMLIIAGITGWCVSSIICFLWKACLRKS